MENNERITQQVRLFFILDSGSWCFRGLLYYSPLEEGLNMFTYTLGICQIFEHVSHLNSYLCHTSWNEVSHIKTLLWIWQNPWLAMCCLTLSAKLFVFPCVAEQGVPDMVLCNMSHQIIIIWMAKQNTTFSFWIFCWGYGKNRWKERPFASEWAKST